ncbi:MAG: hypothetical protein WD354_00280 [Acidimicrobiia bacterium]
MEPLDEGESSGAVTNGSRPVGGPGEPPSWEPPTTPPPPSPFTHSHPGFGGTFITEDAVLSGSLEFQGQRLIMWGAGNPLLTWSPGECLLERLTANRFVLSSNGETITFTADDPDGLDSVLSLNPFGVIETQTNGSAVPPVAELPLPIPDPVEDPPPTSRWPAKTDLSPPPAAAESTASEEPLTPKPGLAPVRKLEPVPPLSEVAAIEAPAPSDVTPIRGRLPSLKAARAKVAAAPEAEVDADLEEAEEDTEAATIADLVVTRAEKLKTVRPRRFLPNDIQTAAVKLGLVSGAIVVVIGFAFAILLILGEGDGSGVTGSNANPTTSIVTVPATAPTTVAVPATDLTTPVFDLSGPEFAERWNVAAAEIDEGLLVSPNLANPFSLVMTPYMTFDGILDSLGGNLRLRAQPTGTVDGDRRILVAIGLLIGTAEPSLTSEQRGQLVELLGLDRNPDLGSINGAATYNGLLYEMVYLSDEGVLQLLVRPEASVPTTATP